MIRIDANVDTARVSQYMVGSAVEFLNHQVYGFGLYAQMVYVQYASISQYTVAVQIVYEYSWRRLLGMHVDRVNPPTPCGEGQLSTVSLASKLYIL